MTSTVNQDESGYIEDTVTTRRLLIEPTGLKDVHEDDIRLVKDVLFSIVDINKRQVGLVLEIIHFPVYYNVTAHVTTGIVQLYDMQFVKNINKILIKKVYYDIEASLWVVQVEKNSAHTRTLDDNTTTAVSVSNGRPKKRSRLAFMGL